MTSMSEFMHPTMHTTPHRVNIIAARVRVALQVHDLNIVREYAIMIIAHIVKVRIILKRSKNAA